MTTHTQQVLGQLDITGAVAPTPDRAVPARRRSPRPAPDQPARFNTTTVQRDCEDCWDNQIQADRDGAPIPFRRRAVVRMRTNECDRYLCSPHARDRGWNPVNRKHM